LAQQPAQGYNGSGTLDWKAIGMSAKFGWEVVGLSLILSSSVFALVCDLGNFITLWNGRLFSVAGNVPHIISYFHFLILAVLILYHGSKNEALAFSQGQEKTHYNLKYFEAPVAIAVGEMDIDVTFLVKLRKFIEECMVGLCSVEHNGALTHKHFQMVV